MDVWVSVVVLVAFGIGYALVSALVAFAKHRMQGKKTPAPPFGAANPSGGYGEDRFNAGGGPSETRAQSEGPWTTNSDPERMHARALGLERPLTAASIKAAYRTMLGKYHPDKVSHLGQEFQSIADRKTREIVEAYEYLSRRYPS